MAKECPREAEEKASKVELAKALKAGARVEPHGTQVHHHQRPTLSQNRVITIAKASSLPPCRILEDLPQCRVLKSLISQPTLLQSPPLPLDASSLPLLDLINSSEQIWGETPLPHRLLKCLQWWKKIRHPTNHTVDPKRHHSSVEKCTLPFCPR